MNSIKLTASVLLFFILAFSVSCRKDKDPISGDVSQIAVNESTQDAQQDEVDDIVTTQLNTGDPAGRLLTSADSRVACANVSYSPGDDDKISGTLSIDFDMQPNGEPNTNGCTDANGNIRKGKITVIWTRGRWFHVGSEITMIIDDYSINGVVINGTRELKNITNTAAQPTWTVEASHTITWPNSLTSTRAVHKTRQLDLAAGTLTVYQTLGADAAASGTTRLGKEYSVQIISGLVYKLSCVAASKVYVPSSGVKYIVFNGKTVAVDYGQGECDDSFTITYSGKVKTVSVKNDGSDD